MIKNFTLIEKKQLTYNIYELIFKTDCVYNMINGQFVTFILDKIGGRAYSIVKLDSNQITLIIKKVELEEGGRGGSKMICELGVGSILKGIGPNGHFTLKQNNNNKLFIGTGTGFVPLFNQINGSIDLGQDCKLKLFFGIRKKEDIFYEKELRLLKEKNKNFDYTICLSRDNLTPYHSGYTIDLINTDLVKEFKEYYICGISSMINSVIEKLKNMGVNDENIFFEKY